jgi:hypothetical protein
MKALNKLTTVAPSDLEMEMAAECHEFSRGIDEMFETGELGECCTVVKASIPLIDLIDEDDLPF